MGVARNAGGPPVTDTEQHPRLFWLNRPERPTPHPAVESREEADLVIVGGGFTGLWAALQAKEVDPGRDVVLLDCPDVPHLGLDFVRERAFPWPPEPVRSFGVRITQRELARADANEGRRGLWLRALDFAGLGFDS
jgi:hypothetical protein